MNRTYKAFTLIILIVFVGFFLFRGVFCSRENSSGDTKKGTGVSLSEKLKASQEGKAELVKINEELEFWERRQRKLEQERSEKIRNGESTEDIEDKLEEARKKVTELKKKQESITDRLSGQ
jgi:hypothetical protein